MVCDGQPVEILKITHKAMLTFAVLDLKNCLLNVEYLKRSTMLEEYVGFGRYLPNIIN